MTTYRHAILTVTHVVEMSLSFGFMSLLCHVFIFGYLAPGPRRQDHVDLVYKHVHFQRDIYPTELAIYAIICRYADMPQPSRRIFSQSFNITFLKNKYVDLQTLSINSYYHR